MPVIYWKCETGKMKTQFVSSIKTYFSFTVVSLTAIALSLTTVWVRIPPEACEKVASDLGLCGGFRRVLLFPPPITTGLSQLIRNMIEKVTRNEIPKKYCCFCLIA